MRRRRAIPAWVPAALAVALASGMYALWVRPTQARIAETEQQARQARSQALPLQAQILRDRSVPPVPMPVPKAEFDHLWPGVIARAQAEGYALQGVTFASAPPLSLPASGEGGGVGAAGPASGQVTPLEITARFAGRYLPLDEALRRMREALPLWAWRSVSISAEQGRAQVTITVDAVVPIEGAVMVPGGPATRPPQVPAPGRPPAAPLPPPGERP